MKLVTDFFNKAAKTIDAKYFPEVKFYRDNEACAICHYQLELFSNGALRYEILLKRLAKACKDTTQNIDSILSEFITER